MLDFGAVQQRGMTRNVLAASGQDVPPHIYVIDPIVQQLAGPDYCAGNGGLVTPNEAAMLANTLHQMGHGLDSLEAERDAARVELEEAQETAGVLYNQLMRWKLIHRWVMIGGGAAAVIGLNLFMWLR